MNEYEMNVRPRKQEFKCDIVWMMMMMMVHRAIMQTDAHKNVRCTMCNLPWASGKLGINLLHALTQKKKSERVSEIETKNFMELYLSGCAICL